MPLIRLEKWRRTTSSTACKCQSGWKTVRLENNIGVGKVKGKKIPSGNFSHEEKLAENLELCSFLVKQKEVILNYQTTSSKCGGN